MADIDLSSIDWNKLNVKEFYMLEKQILSENKNNKNKKDRVSGEIIVKLNGSSYKIKMIVYQRLKNLKSGKSKEKLIQEIISSYNKIEEL